MGKKGKIAVFGLRILQGMSTTYGSERNRQGERERGGRERERNRERKRERVINTVTY